VQVAQPPRPAPETEGLDAVDHLRAVLEHGGRVDTFLCAGGLLTVDHAEAGRSVSRSSRRTCGTQWRSARPGEIGGRFWI
jgi:hypothetical protein